MSKQIRNIYQVLKDREKAKDELLKSYNINNNDRNIRKEVIGITENGKPTTISIPKKIIKKGKNNISLKTKNYDYENEQIEGAIYENYGENRISNIKIKRNLIGIADYGNNQKEEFVEDEVDVEMEYELSEGEAEDYVCDEAELSCPHLIGTNLPIILKVYDKSITFMRDKPIATEKDNKTENFYFDLDEMPRPECELGGKCYITGGYWKEETLSQNVYCNGNRAVLMKSKFCCDKDYSNLLSIEKNGQDYSEFWGEFNDFTKHSSENAYIFKFMEGISDIGAADTKFGIALTTFLFGNPEIIPLIISGTEDTKEGLRKIELSKEASPFINSKIQRGEIRMQSASGMNDWLGMLEGENMIKDGQNNPPMYGKMEEQNEKSNAQETTSDITSIIQSNIEDIIDDKSDKKKINGKTIKENIISSLKNTIITKPRYIEMFRDNTEIGNFIFKDFFPSAERYHSNVDYFKKKRYIIIREKVKVGE